jgi:glycine cleavage system H protein
MSNPDDLLYTENHEWIRRSGSKVVLGITDFAQGALGAVVHVDFPTVGASVVSAQPCAEIESTKSVSEIYAPANGRVVAVNTAVEDQPEVVNNDPYGAGWLIELEVDEETFRLLLSRSEYDSFTASLGDEH